MVLLGKCLPCKPEDLSLVLRTHVKKAGHESTLVIPSLGRQNDRKDSPKLPG